MSGFLSAAPAFLESPTCTSCIPIRANGRRLSVSGFLSAAPASLESRCPVSYPPLRPPWKAQLALRASLSGRMGFPRRPRRRVSHIARHMGTVIVPRWRSTTSMDRSAVRHAARSTILPGRTMLSEAPYCRVGRSLHGISPGRDFSCRDLPGRGGMGLFQPGRDRFSAPQGIPGVATSGR